jgi:hypothetical protein
MLSARTFFAPGGRARLPIAVAAGIVVLPVTWYLPSPLVLTRAASEGVVCCGRFTTVFSTAELAS